MTYIKNGVATLPYPSSHRVTPPLNVLTSLDMTDRTDVTESAAKQTRKQVRSQITVCQFSQSSL